MFFRRVGELASRYRYAVIGAWVLAAVVLNLVIPQLEDVIQRDATTFLPPSSEAMRAYQLMSEKFGGASGRGFAIVVLENPRGLSSADQSYYSGLVARLREHKQRVEFVQDYVSHP